MNYDADVNICRDLSSDESDQLSRISDDSGIEDFFDDMTIQIEPKIIPQPAMYIEEKPRPAESIEENLFIGPKLPEECSDIVPCFPDVPVVTEIKQDVQVDDGIAGLCGLYNLGNTCFMNAALQCLLVMPSLQEVMNTDFTDTPVSAAFLKPLIEELQMMYKKVFSSNYSILHPASLHSSISNLHPLFGDFKQHDSQEFISFVLNIIHDFLVLSSPAATTPAEEHNTKELADNITGEVSKRLKMEHESSMEIEADAGVDCEEEAMPKAQVAWRKHLKANDTLIADKLQGQFQSIITCKKCLFVSTTYEPFMSLSLSIPFAMERQIPVTWVPSPKQFGPVGQLSSKMYLITVKKSGSLKTLKDMFFDVLKNDDKQINTKNIVFAEVKKSANIRVLDDKTQLQYLSKTSDIYALEILSHSAGGSSDSAFTVESDNNQDGGATTWHSCKICFEEKFADDLLVHRTCSGTLCSGCLQSTIQYNQNSVGNFPCPSCNMYISSKEGYEPMTKKPRNEPVESCEDVTMETDGKQQQTWRTCTICLEDTFDEEMRSHLPCGGMICAKCVQVTAGYHDNNAFPCPTCGDLIQESDYTKLASQNGGDGGGAPVIRQVLVPILFRYTKPDSDKLKKKFQMFGKPHITSMPSECTQDVLYHVVSILAGKFNLSQDFDILLTDSSGLSCGLCDFLSTCCGCDVKGMTNIKLKPGCSITLQFNDYLPNVVDTLSYFKEDPSMQSLRTSDTVSLQECMATFADVEILTEDNPWYCPKCQANQVSAKVMSVTRWPETLIIHLKRFHFEETQGSKISCPIDFPLSDLSVELLTCAQTLKHSPSYDLYGCVNHVGSLFGGHYTAFTKQNQENSDWHYFNDSTFKKLSPTEDADYQTEAYVLFYRMKGTGT